MPQCFVNFDRSPTFKNLLDELRKRFPHIDKDLEPIWLDICQDYRHARQADAIPGLGIPIFKYRCKCSDMKRGASGGYRIAGYYHSPDNTLYPILIYCKVDQSDVDAETIGAAAEELLRAVENSK